MPVTVTSIGFCSFDGCINLKTIKLSSSIISIDSFAFQNCTNLSSIDFPNSLTTIGQDTFTNCTSLTSVNLPKSLTLSPSFLNAFYGCSGLTSINVDKSNPNFTSDNGVLFSKDKKRLVEYPGGKQDSSYMVPTEVKEIDSYSFSGNPYLRNLNIPSPSTNIGGNSFMNCTALETVTLPDQIPYDVENYSYLGAGAFMNCTSLTSLIIPKGVCSISGSTFKGCKNLYNLTVPNSVEYINPEFTISDDWKFPSSNEQDPFYGCSSLTIYGEAGSYVESYCKERCNPIPFKVIDNSSTVPNIDKLYAYTFYTVTAAINDRTQKSINSARVAIETLRGTDAAWAIGEFSKQVDQVQHPMLVKIVDAIGLAKNTLKQSDINSAKLSIDPDLPVEWRTSYSSAIDIIQQNLIMTLITAHNKAVISKNQADINAENALLSEIETSIDPSIVQWVDTYIKGNPNTL